MTDRIEKVSGFIKELSANFLSRVVNNTSLLTITRCTVSPDLKKATIFFTVLPDKKEKEALEFVKRQRGELREYLKKNMSTKVVPFVDFEIDLGEKNRQKIDELLRD